MAELEFSTWWWMVRMLVWMEAPVPGSAGWMEVVGEGEVPVCWRVRIE
jgi:hypothetical protein